MKKNILFVFFLLQSVFSFAQSNFKPGIVITNSNDTLQGYIDYRTDEMNARIARFKFNLENTEVKSFVPGEIAGYRFTDAGRYYVSRTIEITAGKPQTVFLEFLVQGMLNLYFYHDRESSLDFYVFEDKNGKMTYTTRRPELVTTTSGGSLLRDDKQFRGIIAHNFQEYKPVQNEVKDMDFDHSSMINFVKNYHSALCITGEECIVFEGKEDRKFFKPNFFVSGGVEYQSFSKKYNNEYFGNVKLTSNNTAPIIRTGVELSMPRLGNSISVPVSVYFSKIEWDLKGKVNGVLTNNYHQIQYFSANRIGVDVSVKYTYPQGRIRPNAEFGLNLLDYNFSGEYNVLFVNKGEIWNSSNDSFSYWDRIGSVYFGAGVNVLVRKEQVLFFNIKYKRDKPTQFYQEAGIPTNNNVVTANIWQFEVGYKF
ncbi:MAG: hypothetical protein LBR75_05505 [Prevotellaceae bacterium]|jgi:hypothetical protein|nr:hypothetical protein [Prevotellaceae bacterium]